jgi:hypothetical protein
MELYLTAQCIRPGGLYLLNVGPNPDLGLSKNLVLEHAFTNLDELCKFVAEKCAPGEVDLPKLKSQLGKGKDLHTLLSKESAVRMGFKL